MSQHCTHVKDKSPCELEYDVVPTASRPKGYTVWGPGHSPSTLRSPTLDAATAGGLGCGATVGAGATGGGLRENMIAHSGVAQSDAVTVNRWLKAE